MESTDAYGTLRTKDIMTDTITTATKQYARRVKRNRPVQVYFTEEEVRRFYKLVDRSGMHQSAYVRWLVVKEAKSQGIF